MVTVIPVHLALTGRLDADLQRVAVSLAQIEEGMDPVLEEELVEMAHFMKGFARRYVPKRTRSLMKSIRVEHIRRLAVRVRAGGYVTNPETNRLVNYAMYVERGTKKMRAQPFMEPAWNQIKDYVSRRVVEVLTELAMNAESSATLTRWGRE